MKCHKAKELISVYLDGELDSRQRQQLISHFATCQACQREVEAVERTWNMLAEVEDIEPDPNYIARFWAKAETSRTWYQKIFAKFRESFVHRRWVPALAMASVLLLVGVITVRNLSDAPDADFLVIHLNGVELEMIGSFDVIEKLEIIQEIDFFTDLEVIESVDL